MSDPQRDELLLVARLRALENTQDGRIIRALLARPTPTPEGRPTCDCQCKSHKPPDHALSCAFRLTFKEHVEASIHEWDRANTLARALRSIYDAVGAEVAIHPGMHDRVARAFKEAASALEGAERSLFPGDDGLPF